MSDKHKITHHVPTYYSGMIIIILWTIILVYFKRKILKENFYNHIKIKCNNKLCIIVLKTIKKYCQINKLTEIIFITIRINKNLIIFLWFFYSIIFNILITFTRLLLTKLKNLVKKIKWEKLIWNWKRDVIILALD